MSLVIKVGKDYITRHGRRVRIFEITPDEVLGEMRSNGKWYSQRWGLDGIREPDKSEGDSDIVDLWSTVYPTVLIDRYMLRTAYNKHKSFEELCLLLNLGERK